MNCEQIEKHLLIRCFLEGALSGDQKRDFQSHVSSCASCQGELQLAASLMLQEPVPAGRAFQEVAERQPSLWARLSAWLFPTGVGVWQPALAFAAVLVVALPMLKMVWLPADPDAAQPVGETWRAGDSGPQPLDQQLRGALGALTKGEPRQAFDLLDSHRVDWDQGRMGNVFTAYRVRARAAAELGWPDAALQDLHRAMSFAELDPERVACVEQDIKAVGGEGDFCPLPEASAVR